MKLPIAILTALLCMRLTGAQDCGCVKLNADETTRQGYSEISLYIEEKPFKILHGTAILNATKEALENVFVEVFIAASDNSPLKRVTGCRTSTDGKFCFTGLAKGKYILRFSKDGGFAITDIVVKVSPKSGRRREITGVVHLGT